MEDEVSRDYSNMLFPVVVKVELLSQLLGGQTACLSSLGRPHPPHYTHVFDACQIRDECQW